MSSDALVAAIGARLKRGRETAKHATVQPATTIAVAQVDDNGVTVTQPKDVEKGNKIFVQLANDQSRTVSVWNIGKIAVPNKEGIPVYVDRNPGGELQIVDADALLMDSAFDQAANSELLPELIDELIRWIMPGRNFKPLRARQAAEYGGLNVVIEDGIFQFNNASYAWLDKTPIDLSTVTVSAGMKRPVLVGIDPATAESAILEGDEISTALPDFTLADYNEIMRANGAGPTGIS